MKTHHDILRVEGDRGLCPLNGRLSICSGGEVFSKGSHENLRWKRTLDAILILLILPLLIPLALLVALIILKTIPALAVQLGDLRKRRKMLSNSGQLEPVIPDRASHPYDMPGAVFSVAGTASRDS